MIGERAYENAMRRRAELRRELEEIETFVRLCERFANLSRASVAQEREQREPDLVTRNRTGQQVEMEAKAIVGVELLPHIRQMALDLGRPVSRGDVKRNLSAYGLRLNAKDEATYIGTVLWRAKDQFVHLKPHGYWPRDVAYAPAGYDPMQEHSGDSKNDDESEDTPDITSKSNGGSATDLWGPNR